MLSKFNSAVMLRYIYMSVIRIVLWFFLHILHTLLVLLGLYHVLYPETLKCTDGAINVTTTTSMRY